MHISFLLAIDDDEGSFGSPGLIFPAKLSFWSKKNSQNFHVLIKLLIQPLLHDGDYSGNIDVHIYDDHYYDIDDDDDGDDSPLCAAPPALRATQEPEDVGHFVDYDSVMMMMMVMMVMVMVMVMVMMIV